MREKLLELGKIVEDYIKEEYGDEINLKFKIVSDGVALRASQKSIFNEQFYGVQYFPKEGLLQQIVKPFYLLLLPLSLVYDIGEIITDRQLIKNYGWFWGTKYLFFLLTKSDRIVFPKTILRVYSKTKLVESERGKVSLSWVVAHEAGHKHGWKKHKDYSENYAIEFADKFLERYTK